MSIFFIKKVRDTAFGWLVPVLPQAEIGIDVSQASTDSHIPVNYGRGYGTGIIIFQGTNDADNDDIKNDLLHQIIVWGEGECGGVTLNYVDDDLSTSTRFNAPNSLKWFYAVNFQNGLAGYADNLLTAAGLRTNDTCESKMCTYTRSEMNNDEVWSGPPNHKAEWTGRLISSPSGAAANASENPIDQLFDYLKNSIYGKGLGVDRLYSSDYWQSQRAIAETLVETYPGSGVNRKLFTSNVSLDTGNSVLDNVNTLCRSMRCLLTISNGKIKPIIEIDQDPVDFPINDKDSGLIEFGKIKNSSKGNRYNRVIVTYRDPDSGWTKQEAIYPPVGSDLEAEYLAADNGIVLEKTTDLKTCIYYEEALHHAKTMLEISREQLRTTILYNAEASILEVGDIIPVTRLAVGWDEKPFRIETTNEDLQTGEVLLGVREHQPYIYDDNNTGDKPNIPDTNLIYTKPATPTNGAFSAVYNNFSQVQLSWDSTTLDHSITISDTSGNTLINELINRKTYQVSGLQIGTYIVNLKAIGGLGRKSETYTFTFDITQPPTPTPTPDFSNGGGIIIVTPPKPTNSTANYEGLWTTNAAINPNNDALTSFNVIPAGTSLSISNPATGVTYYIWYRIITAEGTGVWLVFQQVGQGLTEAQLSALLAADLTLTRATLAAIDTDLSVNIPSEIQRLDDARNVVSSTALDLSDSLESTLSAVAAAILTDGENIDRIFGLRTELTLTENNVALLQTDIQQTASSIELSALRADLEGDINALIVGDVSSALNVAIGNLTGRVDAAELAITPESITSKVEAVVLEQDLASVSFVSSQITALGISDYVQTATLTPQIVRIDTAEQTLNSNLFKRSLTSSSVSDDAVGSIGERLISLAAKEFLAQGQGVDFKGALASASTEITVLSDEVSASTQEINDRFSIVNSSIASAYEQIDTIVDENQTTAAAFTQYQADTQTLIEEAEVDAVATAEEFTRATVGYCVIDNTISAHINKSSCESAGGEWDQLPLAEAQSKVSLTLTRPNGDVVTGSASSLFQVLTNDVGNLTARAFLGVDVNNRPVGVVVTDIEGNQTLSNIDLITDVTRFLRPDLSEFITFNTETNEATFGGVIRLADGTVIGAVEDIRAEDGADGTNGSNGTNGLDGNDGIQGPTGSDGTNGSNGLNSYFHLAYADSITGSGFNQSSAGKSYIGTYVDNTFSDASSGSGLWNWQLVKGPNGANGANGIPGTNGNNGQTSYLHIAYAANSTGSTGFSVSDSSGKTYVGQYVDFTLADSSDASLYSWTLIKGDKGDAGDQGLQGIQGYQGNQGIQGSNGSSSYFHIAYADNSSGGGFNQSPTNKIYIGTYVDNNSADASSGSALWNWQLVKGADGDNGENGIAGTNGSNGQTSYLHIAYANNSSGSSGFSTTNSSNKLYIGQYTDFNISDSGNNNLYSWTLIKGTDGINGSNGNDGSDGNDGIAGTTTHYLTNSTGTFPSESTANADFLAVSGRVRRQDDILVYQNADKTTVSTKRFNGTSWVGLGAIFTGDVLAIGSVLGDRLVAGAEIQAPVITGGTIKTSLGTAFRTEISEDGDFPIWVGSGAKTANNALFYVKNDGTGFIKGDFFEGEIIETKSASFSDNTLPVSSPAVATIGSHNSSGKPVTLTFAADLEWKVNNSNSEGNVTNFSMLVEIKRDGAVINSRTVYPNLEIYIDITSDDFTLYRSTVSSLTIDERNVTENREYSATVTLQNNSGFGAIIQEISVVLKSEENKLA